MVFEGTKPRCTPRPRGPRPVEVTPKLQGRRRIADPAQIPLRARAGAAPLKRSFILRSADAQSSLRARAGADPVEAGVGRELKDGAPVTLRAARAAPLKPVCRFVTVVAGANTVYTPRPRGRGPVEASRQERIALVTEPQVAHSAPLRGARPR